MLESADNGEKTQKHDLCRMPGTREARRFVCRIFISMILSVWLTPWIAPEFNAPRTGVIHCRNELGHMSPAIDTGRC